MYLQHIEMQLLEFGLLLLVAYIGGKITQKLNIGEIVGQILGGILVSPHSLELMYTLYLRYQGVPAESGVIPTQSPTAQFPEYARILEGYLFFVFLLLGIMAFLIGEELHTERLRHLKSGAILIGIFQSILTFALLALGFWGLFGFPLIQALMIGSIGVASAPILTNALVKRLQIEGTLREMLANIVIVTDMLEIVSFAVLLAIAAVLQRAEALSMPHLIAEIATELFWAGVLGLGIFFILKFSLKQHRPPGPDDDSGKQRAAFAITLADHPIPSIEILVMIMGTLALGIGIGIHFRLPFLISAVLAGTLMANFHSADIFDSLRIENITPLFNLFFFALIGSMIQLNSFTGDTWLYIFGFLALRAAGKVLGTWGGCRVTGQDPKMTACLPKLVLPQAGMAAVETILVATVLKASNGMLIFHTIIPAIVMFELVGAWLSEQTLLKWREWTVGEREARAFPEPGEHDFSLPALLADRVFEIAATTKDGAIAELARYCAEIGIAPDMEMVQNLIWEREQLGSTGIGGGIALPHCRTSVVARTQVVCGIARHPVPWGAPDLQPIELVFLILNPDQYPEHHLKAIRTISFALQHTDFLRDIKQAFVQGAVRAYLEQLPARSDRVILKDQIERIPDSEQPSS